MKHLAEVRVGADPAAERQGENGAPTIAELAQRYLAQHAEVKKKRSGLISDRGMLKNHVLPSLGPMRVADVTRAHVGAFHHSMRNIPGMANRVLALLSKMFNLAERWGLRTDGSNPCRHVDRYPERRRERYLSSAELSRLGAALDELEQTGEEPAAAVAALRLLLFTGCRRGEILNLRWDEVDFEFRCLRLRDSKTGPKLLPLNPPAIGVLERLLKRRTLSPWVAEGARQGQSFVGLHRVWDRVRQKAELEDVRIHDLRHSFASFGASSGMGLPLLGALLGHRAAATTARYAHLHTAPLRAASDEIGAKIAAALVGERRTDRTDGEGVTH